jgi:GAF domain-containing protein
VVEKQTPAVPDERIAVYRNAAIRLTRGQFPVQVPLQGSDDVTRLGEAIHQLAETMERKYREMSELARIAEKVNAGLFLDEVLDYVYASFREIIPYDRIGCSLLEDDGRVLRARWARSEAPVLRLTLGYAGTMQGSSLQQVLETGRPRILNDLEEYLRQHPRSELTRLIVEEGVRSSLTCPLINDGKPIGFIFFSSFQPDTYRDVHVELFLQIAGALAGIVEKSRSYKELLELNEAKTRFSSCLEFWRSWGPPAPEAPSEVRDLQGSTWRGLLLSRAAGQRQLTPPAVEICVAIPAL